MGGPIAGEGVNEKALFGTVKGRGHLCTMDTCLVILLP